MVNGICCMQWEGIHELLLRQPRLFGANAERTLRPAVSALTEIGFSRADIARKIMQQPLLLYCKPERYREILRVMQEHGITIEVPPSHPHVHNNTLVELTVSTSEHCIGDP